MLWNANVVANMRGAPYPMDILDRFNREYSPLAPVSWGGPKDYRGVFRNDYSASLAGLGDETISTQVQAGTFTDDLTRGAKEWLSPGAAFTALNDVAMGKASAPIAYTVGLAAPPVIALVILLGIMKGRR